MELSLLVARTLFLVYLGAGIAALSGKVNFANMVKDFEKSPALTYVTGFFTLVIGILLVHYHNMWVKDWRVIITLFAWAASIKGFVLIAFPGVIPKFKEWYKNSPAWGIALIILGLIFGYLGFFM